MDVNLKSLIAKLDDTCRRALEAAAGLCLSRTNYNVEVEHWLVRLIEGEADNDLNKLLRYYEVDADRVKSQLNRSIDGLKTGNSRPPSLSPMIVDAARSAWLLASVEFNQGAVRSGHLLLALLSQPSLSRMVREVVPDLGQIDADRLKAELADIVRGSVEDQQGTSAPGPASATGSSSGMPSKSVALDQFTIDLTERARQGDIDPVLGRDTEIRQVIDILTRRRQNNPILTGEAGVGKTAVVEGFALRVAAGDVPPSIETIAIRTLDLGLLQAGAGVKGEFENRLKSVIEEVKASPKPIVLFIDEAHTLIGAGGSAGQGDAANLLKPALARGELRTIAATTWAEYKKYFERDAALTRRFQVVKVDEPEEKVAVEMMRGLVGTLEGHHGVRILNEAVVDAVKLSSRYITGRQLPDKSVSLLDTTCARIGLSQSATPPALEDCQRRIEQLDVALDILGREQEAGADHGEEIASLGEARGAAEAEREHLEARWIEERELVQQVRGLRQRLETGIEADDDRPDDSEGNSSNDVTSETANNDSKRQADGEPSEGDDQPAGTDELPVAMTPEERAALREELKESESRLRALQGEEPLVHPYVTSQAVAETVAAWTGIPVGRMVSDEIHTVLRLKELMEESVVGQSHALDRIAQSIRTSRANLSDPRTPIGVFLLAGTSGVGKTETAITLAELLYGGEQNMTVINMSEFKEEHKVSLLMGSPPGYVGYGEGGVLTESVRRKPYSVVLLDEMEKAHPGVQDVFYQVFDKGTMKDGEGRDIDFKNTVIIMTTNAGTDYIKSICNDPETMPEPNVLAQGVFDELLKSFKPAFLGRLAIIPYYPLSEDVMKRIVELKLGKVARRVHEHYRAAFTYSPDLVATIVDRCTEVDTGARNVDHILTRTLLPEMSAEFLSRLAQGAVIRSVHLEVDPGKQFRYVIQ